MVDIYVELVGEWFELCWVIFCKIVGWYVMGDDGFGGDKAVGADGNISYDC